MHDHRGHIGGRDEAHIEKYGCNILIGWYFEPYGLIAAQIGHIYHKPLIIIHAGSDLMYLTTHSEAATPYLFAINSAQTVGLAVVL